MIVPNSFFMYINVAIVIIYIVFIIIGYKKGFIFELISLLYTGISALIAWFVSPVLANMYPIIKLETESASDKLIATFIDIDGICNTVLYFIVIFLLLKLLYIVFAFIFKGLNKLPVVGKLNKILGGFAGIFNATIIIIALSMLLNLPVFKNGSEIKKNTFFSYINIYSEKVINLAIENIDLNRFKNEVSDFDLNTYRDEFKKWINSIDD